MARSRGVVASHDAPGERRGGPNQAPRGATLAPGGHTKGWIRRQARQGTKGKDGELEARGAKGKSASASQKTKDGDPKALHGPH